MLLVATLVACGGEEQVDQPDLGEVMPIVPLPPQARSLGASGSEEALQLTFISNLPVDDIATYYRRVFIDDTWTLISDTQAPDGALVLYAENDSRPLWVRIVRTPGAPGTTIQLSGALVARDSALIQGTAELPDSQ